MSFPFFSPPPLFPSFFPVLLEIIPCFSIGTKNSPPPGGGEWPEYISLQIYCLPTYNHSLCLLLDCSELYNNTFRIISSLKKTSLRFCPAANQSRGSTSSSSGRRRMRSSVPTTVQPTSGRCSCTIQGLKFFLPFYNLDLL